MRRRIEQQPLKNNNIHYSRARKKRWLRKAHTSGPDTILVILSAAFPTGAVDGAEPMNLASQSGEAGGSQLLFANFNQDNT